MPRKKSANEYGRVLNQESNWITATGRQDSVITEARELKNIIENEIKNKVHLLLSSNEEYVGIIRQIGEYESHLYNPEKDETYFVTEYVDEDVDRSQFSPEVYKKYNSIYDNYESIKENHNKTVGDLQSQRDQILQTLPNRRVLITPSQRRARAQLQEIDHALYQENSNMSSCDYIYKKVAESRAKQVESDQCKKQHPDIQKLYDRARKIEEGYTAKIVKEALKKHDFMITIQYDEKNASKENLIALGLLNTIAYSNNPAGEVHDLGLPKILDEQVAVIEKEIIEEENKGFQV